MQRAARLIVVIVLSACTQPRDNEARPVPKETRPVAPPAEPPAPPTPPKPTLTTNCNVDADCLMTSLREDCCDHCGNLAVNAESLARLSEFCTKQKLACPAIDCPFQPATAHCDKGTCVRRVK